MSAEALQSAYFSRCPKERQDLAKPAGKLKAVVAAVASVLRPGRAVQVSIQDNRWLSDKEALSTPEVAAFQAFVSSLING